MPLVPRIAIFIPQCQRVGIDVPACAGCPGERAGPLVAAPLEVGAHRRLVEQFEHHGRKRLRRVRIRIPRGIAAGLDRSGRTRCDHRRAEPHRLERCQPELLGQAALVKRRMYERDGARVEPRQLRRVRPLHDPDTGRPRIN